MLCYDAVLLLGIQSCNHNIRDQLYDVNALNKVFQKQSSHTHSLPQQMLFSLSVTAGQNKIEFNLDEFFRAA
jgi:hypothetical protein